jgi:hypothetical protein
MRAKPARCSIAAVTSYAPSGEEQKARRLAVTTLCPSLTAHTNSWRKFGMSFPKIPSDLN